MAEQCWYNKFSQQGSKCEKLGIYRYGGQDAKPGSFLAATRWCEDHRFPSDVLIVTEPVEEAPAEGCGQTRGQ